VNSLRRACAALKGQPRKITAGDRIRTGEPRCEKYLIQASLDVTIHKSTKEAGVNTNNSKAALDRFLVYVTDKNYVKKSTAGSWKSAVSQMLEGTEPSELEDMGKLDQDLVFRRFQNRNGSSLKGESLRVYKSRFSIAIREFLKWTKDPSSYKPPSVTKPRSPNNKERRPAPVNAGIDNADQELERPHGAMRDISHHSGEELLSIPIPLRPGVQVKISGLPANLSLAEARKISAVIAAYALVEE